MRKRERKEERSWREEGRVSATERGRGVAIGRGGGGEEVEKWSDGRVEDAVIGSEWRGGGREEGGSCLGLAS